MEGSRFQSMGDKRTDAATRVQLGLLARFSAPPVGKKINFFYQNAKRKKIIFMMKCHE